MKILALKRIIAKSWSEIHTELKNKSSHLSNDFAWFKNRLSNIDYLEKLLYSIGRICDYNFDIIGVLGAKDVASIKQQLKLFAKQDTHNGYKVRIVFAYYIDGDNYPDKAYFDGSYFESIAKLSKIKQANYIVAVITYSEEFSDANKGKDYFAYESTQVKTIKPTAKEILRVFKDYNNYIQVDDRRALTIFKFTKEFDPNNKWSDLLEQLSNEGKYGWYLMGHLEGTEQQNESKYVTNNFYEISNNIPIYGNATKFVTKWFTPTYDAAITKMSAYDRKFVADEINKALINQSK